MTRLLPATPFTRGLFLAALPALVVLLAAQAPAIAGPGAHGPGGEHLDAPAAAAGAAHAVPRFEAETDAFELVARLAGAELSILIDRYETNEPVLGAQVEIESGGLKAVARFHADHGDYAVDDPAMLKRLATPGEHAIVITVRAGQDSDLLDGTLVVGPGGVPPTSHGHGEAHDRASHGDPGRPLQRGPWIAGAVLAVAGGLAFVAFRRRRPRAVPAASSNEEAV